MLLLCTNQTLNKVKLCCNVVPRGYMYKTKEKHETSYSKADAATKIDLKMHGCKLTLRSHFNYIHLHGRNDIYPV